jgi:murein L,D-transpeptidase YafK
MKDASTMFPLFTVRVGRALSLSSRGLPSARGVRVWSVPMLVLCIASTGMLGGCASRPEPQVTHVDKVVVRKADRKLELIHGGEVFREYKISLGDAPVGHKFREGDERTPEGDYILDWRNPNSSFHKSIHVSYPNARDRAFARAMGFNPGGMIMIHGRPNWLTSPAVAREYDNKDWTNGCIAVKNHEMDEIWRLVRDGTPIRILP